MSPTAAPWFAPATAQRGPTVLLIAELGVNHDGSLQRALELTTMAAAAGARAVKLQLFDARRLLSNQARLALYQAHAGATDPAAMLDRLRLPPQAMREVRAAARELGLAFIVTPFSLPDVDAVAQLEVDAVKVASPDAVNPPLLRAAAGLGRPLLISTGTCALEELEFAAGLLRGHAAGGALLQCVSAYPTPPESAALNAIPVLAERFDVPVGYSDHTAELTAGALAVAAGACVVEKHLTHDRQAQGPDHAASLDPVSFTHYADLLHEAAGMLGPRRKGCLPCEREVRLVSRQSLCAAHDLAAGQVLDAADVVIKRPGTGIPAAQLDATLGRRLARAVKANDLLTPADLA